jgi:preprotein translocase subunit SecB
MADTMNNAGAPAEGPQIGLQKIYLKDASFEAPNTPAIFTGEWKPQITLNLSTRRNDLGEDSIEVVLELTLEAKQGETIAFLAEIQQAGIFLLRGFGDDEKEQVLKTHCPTQLYPYAREVVADLVGKGGFPAMHLQPVSFEAMIAAAEAERRQNRESTAGESASV